MVYQVKRTSLVVTSIILILNICLQSSHTNIFFQSIFFSISTILRISTAIMFLVIILKLSSYIPGRLSACINKLTPNIVTLGNLCLITTSIQNGLMFLSLCDFGPCLSGHRSDIFATDCNPDYNSGVPRSACLFMFIVNALVIINIPVSRAP